jgi:hypothetical protein
MIGMFIPFYICCVFRTSIYLLNVYLQIVLTWPSCPFIHFARRF